MGTGWKTRPFCDEDQTNNQTEIQGPDDHDNDRNKTGEDRVREGGEWEVWEEGEEMKGAAFNQEQVESEMWAFTDRCPEFAVALTPGQWATIVSCLQITLSNEALRGTPFYGVAERTARQLVTAFPKEMTELHKMFAYGFEAARQ